MPQAARTFRIFVSSTFNDLKAERNALQEHVYPRLKELCESRGTHFQAIDLRWGVSEEAALDQQAINICLTEVDRCRETSPRPNFIVLLGDRYGWRPPPPQIRAAEFEAIVSRVSDEERELLAFKEDEEGDQGWYRRDENAVPPERVLREREGEFREFGNWDPVERDLASALRSGVDKTTLQEVPEAERIKYFASATEQEIERGALRVDDAAEHVFCFFREITNLDGLIDDIPEEQPRRDPPERVLAEDFTDLVHPKTKRELDTDAAERLDDLKERLRQALPSNVHDYRAQWHGEDVTTGHLGIGELPETLDGCVKLHVVETARRLLGDRRDASMEEIEEAAKLAPAAEPGREGVQDERVPLERYFSSRDELIAEVDRTEPPLTLCVNVWLRLARVILAELAELEQEDTLEREIDAHRRFGAERARSFTGRRETLKEIASYISGDGPHPLTRPLALHGISGSGKSAVIAKAAQEAAGDHDEAELIVRFIGATPESSDGRGLLASICRQIARRYSRHRRPEDLPVEELALLDEATVPTDYRELVEDFPKRLGLATAEHPLVVFLDAVDQLSEVDGARSLVWLPAELENENVRIVVSALRPDPESDDKAPVGSECFATLETRLLAESLVALEPMTKEEAGELLQEWLKEAGRPLDGRLEGAPEEETERRRRGARTLTEDQSQEVLTNFEHEEAPKGLPLYLKLAFEEARRWRSFTPGRMIKLTPGIPGIIRDNLFKRLSLDENHGEVMVAYSLGYLGAAKHGLSEDELLDVLSEQKDTVLKDFQDRSPRSPKVGHLPVIVWSRLYFDLEPYLGERSSDGASLMSFYHRQLREVVEKDYLAEDGRERHRELAHYFGNDKVQPLERGSNGEVKANLRRLSELPYQQTYGEMWDEVYETLTDFHFLEVKAANSGKIEGTDADGNPSITYTGAYLLQDDYALALERMPGSNGTGGSRRQIIVTATDFGDGYVVRCPHCNTVHTFSRTCQPCGEQHDLGAWLNEREMDCTNPSCNGPLKLNEFTVPPRH